MDKLFDTFKTFNLVIFYWIEAIVLFFVPRRWRLKDVANNIVLITGGGSGLGRILAKKFAEKHAKVVIFDINEKGMKETKHEIENSGGQCWYYNCDLGNRSQIYEVTKKVRNDVGKIDILVNNAGVVFGKKFFDMADDEIVKAFEVNSLSHFWMCKAVLPEMMEDNAGHIVSIASIAGLGGCISLSDYSASKAAAIAFQESVWLELRDAGYKDIHFTIICPFYMNTGMFTGVKSNYIPIMEPEAAAQEIMEAVLSNQAILLMPRIFYFLYPLKTLLPYKSLEMLYVLFGGNDMMKNFVGRKKAAINGVNGKNGINGVKNLIQSNDIKSQ